MSESDQYLNKTKYKEEMENKKREKYYTDKYSFHKIEGYYSLQDVDCLISTWWQTIWILTSVRPTSCPPSV